MRTSYFQSIIITEIEGKKNKLQTGISYTKGVTCSQQAQESKLKPPVLRVVFYSRLSRFGLSGAERGNLTFPSCLH